MPLTAKERILMIRLAQKLGRYPMFAITLGVEAPGAVRDQKTKQKSLTDV